MSEDSKVDPEAFLNRWSRMKSAARETAEAPPAETPRPPAAADTAPELPPLDKLTLDSDFSGFFHPKVDEGLRRAALRKLFSDPHFNVMDGLDVYIDDYSKSEPIPAAMLAGLKQAQRILDWAQNKNEDEHLEAEEHMASDGNLETRSPTPLCTSEPAAREPGPELEQPIDVRKTDCS